MKTSLKAGFAQIFSCCPKNLSCPKFGGAAALLAPPARTPMMRIVAGRGGFTVAWFVAMFENLTKSVSHIVCLIWKFSRGGWRTAFLPPGKKKWRTKCYRLCSSIINAQFKAFWIPILQSDNSLRAPWKRCAKIEPKSKRGSKESWIEPSVIIAINPEFD